MSWRDICTTFLHILHILLCGNKKSHSILPLLLTLHTTTIHYFLIYPFITLFIILLSLLLLLLLLSLLLSSSLLRDPVHTLHHKHSQQDGLPFLSPSFIIHTLFNYGYTLLLKSHPYSPDSSRFFPFIIHHSSFIIHRPSRMIRYVT